MTPVPLAVNEFLESLDLVVRIVGFAIVLLLVAALAVRTARARRLRREDAGELEAVRAAAHEDLVAVGDALRDLDIDAELPGADPAGREALGAAIDLYHRADRELAKARSPRALARARATLHAAHDQATVARRRLSQDASSSAGSGRVSP